VRGEGKEKGRGREKEGEGRGKREAGRGKREEGRGKREEGRGKREEGRGKRIKKDEREEAYCPVHLWKDFLKFLKFRVRVNYLWSKSLPKAIGRVSSGNSEIKPSSPQTRHASPSGSDLTLNF
jgi:hypothetical protein